MLTNDDNFGKRLKYFMKLKKKTALAIAKDLGVTKGAVTNWSNNIRFPSNEDRLIEISKSLNVNFIDLFKNSEINREAITKEELKKNLHKYLQFLPADAILPSNVKKIPFNHGYPTVNKILVGNNMQNAKHIYIDKLTLPPQYQNSNDLQAVIAYGESMYPYLKHGDVAIYTPIDHYVGKGNYVVHTPEGLEIDTITKSKKDQSLIISSQDPTVTTEIFTPDEQHLLEIVGLIIHRILKD